MGVEGRRSTRRRDTYGRTVEFIVCGARETMVEKATGDHSEKLVD
jgi:hypothetical protein